MPTRVAVDMTRQELFDLATQRFGPDPAGWAFVCPACGDVATGQEIQAAMDAANHHTHGDFREIMGQECIGRILGFALRLTDEWKDRGCDWCAYGLIPGPWTIHLEDGKTMSVFPLAAV